MQQRHPGRAVTGRYCATVQLSATRILTVDGFIADSTIVVDDGVIRAIEPCTAAAVPNRIITAGFIDVQVNGIDDIDVATADGDDWGHLDERLVAQGVTTWCPTLVTTALHRYAAPLQRIAAAQRRPSGGRPTIAGVHLEGPFLGGAHGAHRSGLVVAIDTGFLASLPDHVALVTLGAEQPGAAEAIRALRARNVVVSVGHSMASETDFDTAIDAGATLVTHLFNAMSGLHHRSPGVAAWAITNPAVSASLIADGVHVHPRMIRLAFQALGAQRCVLVTDAVAWRAGTAGPVRIAMSDGAPRLPDGTLAGSALTMDAAIRTCVGAGVALADALTAASANPARVLGLRDRGTIAVGQRADIIALDADLRVEAVWVAGEQVR